MLTCKLYAVLSHHPGMDSGKEEEHMPDGIARGTHLSEDRRRYPSREGKRAATVYLDMAVYRKLRIMAAVGDRTLQDVLDEAAQLFIEVKGRGVPGVDPAASRDESPK